MNKTATKPSGFMFSTDKIQMDRKFKVEPHYIFGLSREVTNNLLFLDDQTVAFPSGRHCVLYHTLQRWHKFFPVAKEEQGIAALAQSPDRRYLAVSEFRELGTVTIYNVQNLQFNERKVLTCESPMADGLICMAFSSDSKYLLGFSGHCERILYLWDWKKNKILASNETMKYSLPSQVSFNPRDNTQVCVSGNRLFRIFSLREGSLRQTFKYYKMEEENILCHTWLSKDQIVAGTETGNLLLLFLKFRHVHKLERPYDRQTSKRYSDGNATGMAALPRITAITQHSKGFICSAGPGLVCLYVKTEDKTYYKKTMEIRIPQDPCLQPSQTRQQITSMSLNPSEETLAISTDQGQVYQVNLSISRIHKRKKDNFDFLFHSLHSGTITGLSVCLNKPLAITCSKDNTVRIWNYVTNSLEMYKEFPTEPHCVSFHPTGLSILVGFNNKLCLMNLLVDEFHTVQEFPIASCYECVFNHDGNMFAAVSTTTIHLYHSRTHKKMDLTGHHDTILSLKWSEDDRRLVSCGKDGVICVWNTLTGTCESKSIKESSIYTDVTFSPSNGLILAVSDDNKMKEFQDDQLLFDLNSGIDPYTSITMSHSGNMIFVGTSGGAVRVIEYPFHHGEFMTEYQGHSGPITKMVVTPGDHYLLTASEDGTILIWTITDHMGHKLCMWKEIDYSQEVLCAKTYLEEKKQSLQETNTQMKQLKLDQDLQLTQKDVRYNKKIDHILQDHVQQIEDLKHQIKMLTAENKDMKALHQKAVEKHTSELENEKRDHVSVLYEAHKRTIELEDRIQEMQREQEEKVRRQEERHLRALEEMKQSYEAKLAEQQASVQNPVINIYSDHSKIKACVVKYEQDLQQEKERNTNLQHEKDRDDLQQRLRISTLKKALLDRNKSITKLQADLKRKHDHHQNALSQLKVLTKANEEQKKTICAQKTQISSLLTNLERAEKSQDCEILKSQVKQLRQERDQLKKSIFLRETGYLDRKLDAYKQIIQKLKADQLRKDNLNKAAIEEVKKKLTTKDQELLKVKQKVKNMTTVLEKIKADIHMGSTYLHQPRMLKDHYLKLHKRYI